MKNSLVLKRAKILRKQMTGAEKVLWEELRRGILGKKFRRQMPFKFGIYNYVADFYCASSKLIIEVDGGIHDNKETEENDIFREDIFEEMGYEILRFKNEEILNNLDQVINIIKKKIT